MELRWKEKEGRSTKRDRKINTIDEGFEKYCATEKEVRPVMARITKTKTDIIGAKITSRRNKSMDSLYLSEGDGTINDIASASSEMKVW